MRHDEILRLLASRQVEAIVVGMAAGILRGAPLTTEDVHIVHRRTPDNVARLLGVLPARPKDLAAIPVLESTLEELESD